MKRTSKGRFIKPGKRARLEALSERQKKQPDGDVCDGKREENPELPNDRMNDGAQDT